MKAHALVSRNVRRLRVRLNLSQENLSLEAGVNRTYVSRLERGLENPTLAVLERLADALKVEVVELFTKPKAGEAPPKPLRGGRRSTR
jgi:transcriptional regulator with XRE-family HTH domain